MNKKLVLQFTALTFIIMLIAWGSCVICGQFGITLSNNPWLYAFYLIGGWSPTFASFVILKKNNQITGIKEWLKTVFYVKAPIMQYIFCILMTAMIFITKALISGIKEMSPFYMLFITLPVMLIGGGITSI